MTQRTTTRVVQHRDHMRTEARCEDASAPTGGHDLDIAASWLGRWLAATPTPPPPGRYETRVTPGGFHAPRPIGSKDGASVLGQYSRITR